MIKLNIFIFVTITWIILINLMPICFAGQLCLTCRNVVDPGACSTVTKCGTHEECSMTQYLTANGLVLYDLGCKAILKCRSITGKRRHVTENDINSESIPVCEACCNDTAVCNLGGMCGVKHFNLNGGTLCFSCNQMTQPDNCGQITLCSSDQVCYIGQKIVGLSGIKVNEARCANPQTECPNGVSTGSSLVFGKRANMLDHPYKRQSEFCRECCTGHMCNNKCSLLKQVLTTSKTTSTTSATTTLPLSPPKVTNITIANAVHVGVDVKLVCSVTGNPKPNVSWNVLHDLTTGMNYEVRDNGHTLVIINYQPHNNSKYMCYAKNSIGEDSKIITLHG